MPRESKMAKKKTTNNLIEFDCLICEAVDTSKNKGESRVGSKIEVHFF